MCQIRQHAMCYFYPRSPCGERLPQLGIIQPVADISIHALLAESDRTGRSCSTCHPHFYPRSPCGERRCMMVRSLVTVAFLSTLSLRRATRKTQRPYVKDSISIHALLAESDTTGCPTDTSLKAFLSTLSLRRATMNWLRTAGVEDDISIHALLAESDPI